MFVGLLRAGFGVFRGHVGSRIVIRASLSDCCCLFRVLIQSVSMVGWTGSDKKEKKKYTYLYVFLCCYFRGVCESHSRFEEKASTFVFSAVRKYFFFRGADAILLHFSSGQIESSLVRIHFKKSNPQVLLRERLSCWRTRRTHN